jgi:predicted Zn-dependent protease
MKSKVRQAVVCTAIAFFGIDAEAAVRAYRPPDHGAVLLRLDSGDAQLERLRRAAHDPAVVGTYVRALMASGNRSGDERYYGYAEQALLSSTQKENADLQLLRAQLLQHRHEFHAAETQLTALVARDPRDRAARLMRAQVRLHLNQPAAAMQDCLTLVPLVDLLTATTCIAQAKAAAGDLTQAYRLVTTAMAAPGGDDQTRSWSAGVAAEFAGRLGDTAAADQWFQAANRLDPDSHYARVSYADWLLWQGACERALQVSNAGASIADRTRAVLASRTAASDEARQLQLLWREADARGERGHLRDLARFHWLVLNDVRGAHSIALDNFRDHQDGEDALLLANTSLAMRDRDALARVARWQREHHYQDARLEQLLRDAG